MAHYWKELEHISFWWSWSLFKYLCPVDSYWNQVCSTIFLAESYLQYFLQNHDLQYFWQNHICNFSCKIMIYNISGKIMSAMSFMLHNNNASHTFCHKTLKSELLIFWMWGKFLKIASQNEQIIFKSRKTGGDYRNVICDFPLRSK